ncbi:MAG: hypothetical protein WDM92_08195 [Caulobacteraceae bacterium]
MRVACLGGGPAGLYLAISLKLRDPRHEVEVFERNRAGDTFGWGVVFSDQTLDNLRRNDPVSAETIVADFTTGDDSWSAAKARPSARPATVSSASAASAC